MGSKLLVTPQCFSTGPIFQKSHFKNAGFKNGNGK
jgi:hypothetical protein